MESTPFIATFVSMKKIFGKLILTMLFITLWGCEETAHKTGTLMDFVPEKASVVLKISNWESLQADIENNSLLSKYDKTSSYLFFSEETPLLKNLKPNSPILLCINKINDSLSAYTFISIQTANLFPSDSIKNKTIETLQIEDKSLQRVTIDNKIAFIATIDSVFIASSSQQILMEILKGKTERGASFKKVFELPNSNEFTALIRGNELAATDSVNVDFNSWTAIDVSIKPESFKATGITMAADSIPQLLDVFEGQVPQQNDLAVLTPIEARSAMSFTFDDAEKLQNKLRKFRGEKEAVKTTGIFDSSSEVGTIELKNETVFFIKSIDASITGDALAQFVEIKSSFREIEIKNFSEPQLFRKTFYPLISSEKANFVFQLDNFFIFTESETSAQELIASFQNNSTLKNTAYFEKTAQDLSSASSLLILKLQGDFSETISSFLNFGRHKDFQNISFEKYPVAALQYSFDRNFAHVTLICKEENSASKTITQTVSEKFNISLENTILGSPQIIGNNGNVAVQDIGNKLYYISENGKILWTKNLGSPILGKIEEVDIFGKGNKQMAFATKNAVYILDRNGKDANSFPLKFKDEITQPLSVFDYDNNHKYRFVVIQGKEVLLYNKDGKIVKGFGFSKAKSNIILSPEHFRIGKKDYIVIAEENGSLNILSRVGKPRISVSKKFNFSEIPITVEDNTFVVITKENSKERVSEDGKVTSQKLDVGSSYWFAINGNTKATLDNNLLRIEGKLAELPIGLYSKPQVFQIGQKTYVTITETQENKVYVFDKNGNLAKGFPVYGTSEASIGRSSATNGISLTVKSDAKGLVVYSIN